MVYRRQRPKQRGEEAAKVPYRGTGDESVFAVMDVEVAEVVQGEQLIRADQDDEEVIELASHIATHGLLQPIGVSRLENGYWQLLYGARRLGAVKRLGWRTIPAHIHQPGEQAVKGLAAAENLLRRQLTIGEEVDVVCHMHEQEGRSPNEIASLVGKGRSWVLRRLAIPAMPIELREPLLAGRLAIAVCEEIARVEDAGLRRYVLETAKASDASAGEVRSMVEAIQKTPSLAAAIQAGVNEAASPVLVQALLVKCAACGAAREPAETQIVRICAAGCDVIEPAAAETEGVKDA